jgi:hypothetical protein
MVSGVNGKAVHGRFLVTGSTPITAEELETTEIPVVNITVPFGPIPVASIEGINIAYELELTPPEDMVLVPEMLEVIDQTTGDVIYSENRTLLDFLYHPAAVPPPTEYELQNGTDKLLLPRISIWFKVSPDAVPDTLVHRLTLNQTVNGLSQVTITGGEVSVKKDLAPVGIDSPLKGPGWFVMETTTPMSHHFRSQITLKGVTRVPQRYAQDYIFVDPGFGAPFSGNDTIARDFFGFGKEIFAVTDGIVIEVHDGLPDIENTTEVPPASFATAGSNSVILDIGDKKYACYAHMVNGSILVKPGDIVKEGQIIGHMGNSGNSDLPHLHFQIVTDNPFFFGAEGYPFVFTSFDEIGIVNLTSSEMMLFEEPVHYKNILMENDAYVSFP